MKGGRRLATFEYPKRNQGRSDDMGRKLHRHSLELFVIGKDYMGPRDQLIAALDSDGPCWLVHPYLGELYVAVDDYDMVETTKEGGMAKFSVQLVEQPSEALDDFDAEIANQVEAVAAVVQVQAQAAFEAGFAVKGQSSYVQEVTQEKASGIGAFIAKYAGLAGQFNVALRQFSNRLTAMLLTPGVLALSVIQLQRSITGSLTLPRTALNAQRELLRNAMPKKASWRLPAATPSHIQARKNEELLQRMVAIAALVELASVVSTNSSVDLFDSEADREVFLGEWVSALDEQVAFADTDLLAALGDLRVAFVREWKKQGRLVIGHYRVALTTPAVVLAHRATGDATDVDELVARNRVRHPLFVMAGSKLEMPRNGNAQT